MKKKQVTYLLIDQLFIGDGGTPRF